VQEIWEATSANTWGWSADPGRGDSPARAIARDRRLLCDVPPDSMEVFRRHQKHERMLVEARLWTPLALRFPLAGPGPVPERTLPWVQPLFGWFGILLWLIVVGDRRGTGGVHWTDLTEDIADRVLDPGEPRLLWFVYPVVKALHELGHAYVTRKWGGEVHEIGIMLLVLSPVPYVDASASWGFKDKRKRMVVGAAGIAVELFLGSLALFVWLVVEPGAVRAVAYNVMLISGVSTLLFNGNPLLRFDGYYVLADAIEMPNLGRARTSISATCSSATCSASSRRRISRAFGRGTHSGWPYTASRPSCTASSFPSSSSCSSPASSSLSAFCWRSGPSRRRS
jgi:hypothetical protein